MKDTPPRRSRVHVLAWIIARLAWRQGSTIVSRQDIKQCWLEVFPEQANSKRGSRARIALALQTLEAQSVVERASNNQVRVLSAARLIEIAQGGRYLDEPTPPSPR